MGYRLRELAPTGRGSQEEGFTQPRDHLLADPCTVTVAWVSLKPVSLASGDACNIPPQSFWLWWWWCAPFWMKQERIWRHSIRSRLLIDPQASDLKVERGRERDGDACEMQKKSDTALAATCRRRMAVFLPFLPHFRFLLFKVASPFLESRRMLA